MMAQEYDRAVQSLSDGDYSAKAAVEVVEAAFSQCEGVPSRYEAVIRQCERALLILEKSRKRLTEIMEKSQVKIFVLEGEKRCYSCKRFVEDNSLAETKAEFEALHRRKMGIGRLKDLVDKKKNNIVKLLSCRPWWKDWQCGTESTGRGIEECG
ncbi:hypothetical protein FH972_009757 [Carpinus fangiana]|uniref:Uncharacterized protein n=1 Tax=Carpinus fangiana TaxID=176857 RepID=A0A660KL73_9ROSI|nr:hypothetical protein FH972_009757 [Carpinus fangiana]